MLKRRIRIFIIEATVKYKFCRSKIDNHLIGNYN